MKSLLIRKVLIGLGLVLVLMGTGYAVESGKGVVLAFRESEEESHPPDEPAYSYPVNQSYQPGMGKPVGSILAAKEDGRIVHAAEKVAYPASTDRPLYQGDTVLTKDKSMISLRLNDGSQITLSPNSSVAINQSLYEPDKKTRQSFIRMGLGKVRFWIKELVGFESTDFKIKTKTAILGVRGSDFIVKSTLTTTEVITLEKTRLEILNLAAPDKDMTILSEFEKTVIRSDALASPIEEVLIKDAEMLMKDLPVSHEEGKMMPEPPAEVLVPGENLIPPDTGEVKAVEDTSEIKEFKEMESHEEEISDIQEGYSEKSNEDKAEESHHPDEIIPKEAPDFPSKPMR
jgi:hypothetical protein